MQVQQLMTPAPRTSGWDANICEAVQMMWEGNFGILPITDDAGVVRGVVTDRDIAIALGTRNRVPSDVRVADVMSKDVATCAREDEVAAALAAMKQRRVRRLPVVDVEGRLCGLLSLDDIILSGDRSVQATDVLEALRAIYERPVPFAESLVTAA